MNANILQYIVNSTSFLLVVLIAVLIFFVALMLFRFSEATRKLKRIENEKTMYQRIFTYATVPLLIIDSAGEIELSNDKAAEFYGKKIGELNGTFFDSFNIVRSSLAMSEQMSEAIRANKRYSFNSKILANGKRIECRFEVSGLLSGKNPRYLIMILPIDEIIKTERDNDLREIRINKLEDIAGAGFWVYHPLTNNTKWSRGMYSLLGATINEAKPDLSFISLINENAQQEIQELIMAIQRQLPYSKRVRLKGYDGVDRYVDIELMHQEGLDENGIATMGIMREVLTLDQILDNKGTPKGYLGFTSPNTSIYITTLNENDEIEEVNESFRNYLGDSSLIGTNFYDNFEIIPIESSNSIFHTLKNNSEITWKIYNLSKESGKKVLLGIEIHNE